MLCAARAAAVVDATRRLCRYRAGLVVVFFISCPMHVCLRVCFILCFDCSSCLSADALKLENPQIGSHRDACIVKITAAPTALSDAHSRQSLAAFLVQLAERLTAIAAPSSLSSSSSGSLPHHPPTEASAANTAADTQTIKPDTSAAADQTRRPEFWVRVYTSVGAAGFVTICAGVRARLEPVLHAAAATAGTATDAANTHSAAAAAMSMIANPTQEVLPPHPREHNALTAPGGAATVAVTDWRNAATRALASRSNHMSAPLLVGALHVDGRVTNSRGSAAYARLLESVLPRGASSSSSSSQPLAPAASAAGRAVLASYYDFARQPGARRSLRDFMRAHCGFVDAEAGGATVHVDGADAATVSDPTQQQHHDATGSDGDFESAPSSAIDNVNVDDDGDGDGVRRSAFGDLFSRLAREFEDELERIVWG